MIHSTAVNAQTAGQLLEQIERFRNVEPTIQSKSRGSFSRSLLREKFSGRQRMFWADVNGKVVGHVVSRLSPSLVCCDNNPLGMLGFFDAFNEPDATRELLQHASDWLESNGATSIVGPMDGDTWHHYRINTGPFIQPPFLMEPGNPSWYDSLWQSAGFRVIARYHSRSVDNMPTAIQTSQSSLQRAREHGFRFRQIDRNRFEEELKIIYQVSCQCFTDNFLYDKITWNDFLGLYAEARAMVEPRLIWIAEDSRGDPAGFLFALVDYYRAVKSMRGKQGVTSKLRFLWNRRHANAVNFKSMGVLPEHRRKSIGGALMNQGFQSTYDLGFRHTNLCLIRDGNPSSRLDGGIGKVFRRYVLYQSPDSRFTTN